MRPNPENPSPEALCLMCRGRIGVYEPLVVLDEDGPRVTSRAAEPWLTDGPLFHQDCYQPAA